MQARVLFKQSLAIASDLPEAKQALETCPPDPPSRLRVEVRDWALGLDWLPPAADGSAQVVFRILRKRRGAPEHYADGETLAETDSPFFEDRTAEPGEQYAYIVVSRVGGLESSTAAISSPIWYLPPVQNLRVESRDGEVELAWEIPEKATGAKVVRKIGAPPTGPGDGESLPNDKHRATDRGLGKELVYHYAVYAQYRIGEGVARTSKPVFASTKAVERVVVLDDLSAERTRDGRVRLAWTPPLSGVVKILASSSPTPVVPASLLDDATTSALAGRWIDDCAGGQTFDIPPPVWSTCYYTPFVSRSGRWTAGKMAIISTIEDPKELCMSRINSTNRLLLRWQWPDRLVQCMVVAAPGEGPANLGAKDSFRFDVHKEDYDRTGSCIVTIPPAEGAWRIRVFGVHPHGSSFDLSPGVDLTAEVVLTSTLAEVAVRYRIKKHWLPGKKWTLELETDPPGSTVPPTVLVAHSRTTPISVDDGAVVARFPTASDGAKFPIERRADLASGGFRLFIDPAAATNGFAPVRFIAPEGAGPRL